MKPLNLDELTARKHTVSKGGTVYEVEPITARVLSVIDAATADGLASMARVRLYGDAVAMLLPGMTREEVNGMTTAQLLAVVRLASSEVEAVEAANDSPNGSGSAPAMTTAPTTEPTAAVPAAT